MLALEGIKILDLTWQGPGPFCTMVLGDLGAEVVKVGAPPGAGARQFSAPADERELAYQATNRNKKSILINLKSTVGRAVFLDMAAQADVIVDGFRPGVSKRLGIDYETVKRTNPRLVYCAISGYGQDGPYHQMPNHDINCISIAGALNLIGEAGRKPAIPLNLLADFGGAGMSAAVGILSALIARSKTGKGQYVDIAMTDATISLLTQTILDHYFCSGRDVQRGEHHLGGGFPYYNVYQTGDGKFVTIGCLEPWLWEKFCRAIGKEEFIPFSMARGRFDHDAEDSKWSEISAFLEHLFLIRTRDEWFDLLRANDVPVGKVYSLDEVFADPQVLYRKMVIEVEHPKEGKVRQVGIAIKLSETPGEVRRLAPTPGQNTDEILLGLGYGREKIGELRREAVIG